jgi:hypothetical protein
MTLWRQISILLWLGLFSVGCRRSERITEGPLPPLEPAHLAERPGIVVFQPQKVTMPVPLEVSVVDEIGDCTEPDRVTRAFVICAVGGSAAELTLSERIRGALRELAERRLPYLRKGPVTVIGTANQTETVFRLAGEEPSFFAGLVLRGADAVRVSNSRIFGFGQGGGKKVALVGVPSAEVARIKSSSVAGSVRVAEFPGTPEGLRSAIEFARVDAPLVSPEPPPL